MDALLTANTSSREVYEQHLTILDKRNQLVPFVPNRAQRHFIKSRTGRDLILKARQLGLSTAIQADYFVTGITETALIATLAHDDTTTQKLRRMAKRFYDGLPADLCPQRGLDNATTTTYPDTGSEVTIVTAGSPAAGRGGTYSHVHGSEVAFWKDAEGIMAGILQGVPTDGQIVLESTPNGAQGWFYERCMEALDGNSDWTLHFYPWWWDDGYQLPIAAPLTLTDEEQQLVTAHNLSHEQIAWRRSKQRELGRLFLQEYPEDPRSCFLLSGVGYFGDIDHVFTAPTNAAPTRQHRYVAGLDFAQTVDYTVLSVLDATDMSQVDLLRVNQLPWAEMRRQVVEACRKWSIAVLVAERNSMGSTNIEALVSELKAAKVETRVLAFDTSNTTKARIIGALHTALHERELKLLPHPAQRRELQAFTSKQTLTGLWQFAAPDGEHDDTVMALALGLDAILGRQPLTVQTSKWA